MDKVEFYLKEENKGKHYSLAEATKDNSDGLDLDALDNFDFDNVLSAVEEKRDGGAEIFEASNVCESGACAI